MVKVKLKNGATVRYPERKVGDRVKHWEYGYGTVVANVNPDPENKGLYFKQYPIKVEFDKRPDINESVDAEFTNTGHSFYGHTQEGKMPALKGVKKKEVEPPLSEFAIIRNALTRADASFDSTTYPESKRRHTITLFADDFPIQGIVLVFNSNGQLTKVRPE